MCCHDGFVNAGPCKYLFIVSLIKQQHFEYAGLQVTATDVQLVGRQNNKLDVSMAAGLPAVICFHATAAPPHHVHYLLFNGFV